MDLWWIDELGKLRKEQLPKWEPEQLQLPEIEPFPTTSSEEDSDNDSGVEIIEDP